MVSPLATVPNYTHVITTGTVIHWPSYVGYPRARCLYDQLTILSCRSVNICASDSTSANTHIWPPSWRSGAWSPIGVISFHARLLERCPGKSARLISFDIADTQWSRIMHERRRGRGVYRNPSVLRMVTNNGLAQESMMCIHHSPGLFWLTRGKYDGWFHIAMEWARRVDPYRYGWVQLGPIRLRHKLGCAHHMVL